MPVRHHLVSLSLFLTATLALAVCGFYPSQLQAKTLPEFIDFAGPLSPTDSIFLWDASAAGHATDPLDPNTVEATAAQLFAPFAADPTWSADFSAANWATALNITSAWGDVTGTPTTLSGYGITDAATTAQGATADTATQPGDNLSTLANDSGFTAIDYVTAAPVTATSTGTTGQVIYAGNYLYICIATDTWRRAQLLNW